MNLIYNGVDIAGMVAVTQADILDNAGGLADSLEVAFNDTDGVWSSWKPAIGDTMQIAHEGFDSGVCYVDEIGQARGLYIVKALSIPMLAKEKRSRSWEQITLLQLAADIASKYDFELKAYNVPNPTYERVDQANISDFTFLDSRCRMEGCALKISNRQVIIYSESAFEAQPPAKTLTAAQFDGEPEYSQKTREVYGSCVVAYGSIQGEYQSAVKGATLEVKDVYVSSIGEAQRFAKGMLRGANKAQYALRGKVALEMSMAGGSMISVSDIGTADGIYMVDQLTHSIVQGRTHLKLRRRLEGY